MMVILLSGETDYQATNLSHYYGTNKLCHASDDALDCLDGNVAQRENPVEKP